MLISELARLADTCLAEAWRMAEGDARERFGAARDDAGAETGMAVIGMGKLGGQELNYSSDIDLMFVYGAEGDTAGGREGRLSNGEYFGRVGRDIVEGKLAPGARAKYAVTIMNLSSADWAGATKLVMADGIDSELRDPSAWTSGTSTTCSATNQTCISFVRMTLLTSKLLVPSSPCSATSRAIVRASLSTRSSVP